MTTREAFEAWITDDGKWLKAAERSPDGSYKFMGTHTSWTVWQAATKAEREACARVCDRRVMGDNNREDQEAKKCASAIRSRTQEGEKA
jgi:hypothetical protein